MLKRFEITVKGEVQKVAFRQFVKWLAKKHGLYGKVENLRNYDEDVLIVLEGKGPQIRNFLQRLSNLDKEDKARTAAKIAKIVPKELPYSGEFKDKEFEIVSRGNELQERLDEGVLLLKHLSSEMGGLRSETKSGFGKMDKNFGGLGDKIDKNFGGLDRKYGCISGILLKINGNLEKLVGK